MPIHVDALQGNTFLHGLPVNADMRTGWCSTWYPALVCTCGACRLTWEYSPQSGDIAQPCIIYAGGDSMVHAANPKTGEGLVCLTVCGASTCSCGRYQIVWEPLQDMTIPEDTAKETPSGP